MPKYFWDFEYYKFLQFINKVNEQDFKNHRNSNIILSIFLAKECFVIFQHIHEFNGSSRCRTLETDSLKFILSRKEKSQKKNALRENRKY